MEVENYAWVGIFFGVKNLADRHNGEKWHRDLDDIGSIDFDHDFDMSDPESQILMLELCQEILNDTELLEITSKAEYHESFWCWIHDFA